jgi:hypothetical protein
VRGLTRPPRLKRGSYVGAVAASMNGITGQVCVVSRGCIWYAHVPELYNFGVLPAPAQGELQV